MFYKKKAVLVIHGFAGTPYDEEILINYLQLDKHMDVFFFTLPGHQYGIFMNCKYEEWIKKSEYYLEYLINNGYDNIYVIGHSMGGVIATYLTTKYKQIKKLVLAAPAFKCFYNQKDNIFSNLKKGKHLIDDYGYEEIFKRTIKASFKGAKEFMKLVREYYDCPKHVHVPTLIIQGLADRIVASDSSFYVYDNIKDKKQLVYIENVDHDVFHSDRVDEINKIIKVFLNKKYIKDSISNI